MKTKNEASADNLNTRIYSQVATLIEFTVATSVFSSLWDSLTLTSSTLHPHKLPSLTTVTHQSYILV